MSNQLILETDWKFKAVKYGYSLLKKEGKYSIQIALFYYFGICMLNFLNYPPSLILLIRWC